MKETGIEVDYAFFPKVHGRDIVYYGKRGEHGVMCAGMSHCDAVIIADTPEELIETAKAYQSTTMSNIGDPVVIDESTPKPITWHTLTSEWRWVIYKNKARYVIGGIDFCATAITDTPGTESALTADPTTVVVVAMDQNMQYVRHNDAVIIGQDVPDILHHMAVIGIEPDTNYMMVSFPLMVLAREGESVWYGRAKHDVRKTLEKNIVLLMGAFSELSLDEISANSNLIIQKLKEIVDEEKSKEEKTDEN